MPPRSKAPARKLVSLDQFAGSQASPISKRRNHTNGGATFDLYPAMYQKGDKAKQLTGRIYFRGKPRYGNNERFKELVNAVMLAESLRWNEELKLYTGVVWSDKIAAKILNAMRNVRALPTKLPNASLTLTRFLWQVSDADAADLPTEVPQDKLELFDAAKSNALTLVPVTVNDEIRTAIGGPTYAWKQILPTKGFQFTTEFQGKAVQLWLSKDTLDNDDIDELVTEFEDFGFPVTKYDGLNDA